jgi:hypothetical protein
VTREEKDLVVEEILSRYGDVGEMIVNDEPTLCRLLSTLEMDSYVDREIGEYLCSFLTV